MILDLHQFTTLFFLLEYYKSDLVVSYGLIINNFPFPKDSLSKTTQNKTTESLSSTMVTVEEPSPNNPSY